MDAFALTFRLRLALIGLTAALLAMGGIACWHADFRPSDDNLWLYMVAHKLDDPSIGEREGALITALADTGYGAEGLARMDMRLQYEHNYLAALLLYRVGYALTPEVKDDYPLTLARRIIMGFAASYAAAAVLLLTVLWRCAARRPVLCWAVPLGLALCLAAMNGQSFYFILKPEQSIWTFVVTGMVDPGPQFSVFGFTPRSQFAAIILSAFLLRWSGRPAASYWVLLAAMLVHQSHGGFMLAVMIWLDVLWKGTAAFRNRSTLCAIGVMAALFTWRESLWRYIGWQAWGAVILAGVLLGLAWVWMRRRHSPLWLMRMRAWAATHPVLSDALELLEILFWLSVITVTARWWVDPVAHTYFWGQLPTRFLSMVQPVLAVALAYGLLTAWQQRKIRAPWLVPAGVVLVLVVARLATGWAWQEKPYEAAVTAFRAYDGALNGEPVYPAVRMPHVADEALWYYALVREADTGVPGVMGLFSAPARSSAAPAP